MRVSEKNSSPGTSPSNILLLLLLYVYLYNTGCGAFFNFFRGSECGFRPCEDVAAGGSDVAEEEEKKANWGLYRVCVVCRVRNRLCSKTDVPGPLASADTWRFYYCYYCLACVHPLPATAATAHRSLLFATTRRAYNNDMGMKTTNVFGS